MKNIMIDIETLGNNKMTAPMISIAAVRFSLSSYEVDIDNVFFRNITLDSALQYGQPDAGTVKWWLKDKADQLKDILFDKTAVDTATALEDLGKWNTGTSMSTWCKGMDFDFGIIDRLLVQTGVKNPLSVFWKRYDVRTFEAMAQHLGVPKANIGFRGGLAHDAKADVIQQADLIIHYSKVLKGLDT